MTWKSNLVVGDDEVKPSDGLVNVGGFTNNSTMKFEGDQRAGMSAYKSGTEVLSTRRNAWEEDPGLVPETQFYEKPKNVETIPESALDKVNFKKVPQEICSTLSKVVNQLDIITSTLGVLEQRLDSNESQANQALEYLQGLDNQQPCLDVEEKPIESPPQMMRQPNFVDN